MPKRTLILNKTQIDSKINRIAYQILEDNIEEKELVIAGIVSRGYILANRIIDQLTKIASFKIILVKIDLDKDSTSLKASTDIPLSELENKVIIIVDDVLSSGRTLGYGLGVFLNMPAKKIRTAVLIDRGHTNYPIAIDFVGYSLATVMQEHVSVIIGSNEEEDAVYLI